MPDENIFNRAELLDSLDNDEALAGEIVAIFLTDMQTRLTTLGDAAVVADHKALLSIAHAIKGSAAYVYAPGIRQAAAVLEERARIGAANRGEYAELVAGVAGRFREFTRLLDLEQA